MSKAMELRPLDVGSTSAISGGGPDDTRPGAVLVRPALLGLVATIAITFGASQFSSPFTLKVPGAWYFGVPPLTTPPGRGLLLSLVASYGGMFLLIRVWLETMGLVSRRRLPVRWMWLLFGLWIVPLLVAPPLFSRDVYSYAAQGDMVSLGINPYLHGPLALGWGSYLNPVDRLWWSAPAPYGPVFVELAAGIVNLSAHHELGTVVGLRLLELFGVILIGAFLPTLARSVRRDEATVFCLAVLNPVTLLHLVAGAHNDALMLGLLVAGLACAKRDRPVVGVVLCTLAAAVKVPAALGVLYIGWHWLGTTSPWRTRVRPLLASILLSTGVMAVIAAASGLGWGWVKALDNPSAVRSVLDPPTALGMLLGTITHVLHLGIGVHGMLTLTRTLGLLVAVVTSVYLFFVSDRIGMIRALGGSLLVFTVMGPVIQPWYLAWGIVMLAPVSAGRTQKVLVGITVAGSFIGFPGGWALMEELGRSSLWQVAAAVLVLVAIPGPPLWSRIRSVAVGVARRARRASGLVLVLPEGAGEVRFLSADQALHHHHVQPAAELASDLPLHPHQVESAGPVQADGGLVATDDAGHDGMESVPFA